MIMLVEVSDNIQFKSAHRERIFSFSMIKIEQIIPIEHDENLLMTTIHNVPSRASISQSMAPINALIIYSPCENCKLAFPWHCRILTFCV